MKQSKLRFLFLIYLIYSTSLFSQNDWKILVPESLQNDEAIKVAIADLIADGANHDFQFSLVDERFGVHDKTIIIGSEVRNEITKELLSEGKIDLQSEINEQGYQIITKNIDSKKLILVAGGSILAEVYGIFWILDRIKVFKTLPDINTIRQPKLEIRFTNGNSKEKMKQALRYGATWVWGAFNVNQLVPWDSEPERTENLKNREKLKELIDYAHSLHLKYIVYEDEFSFHPSLLEEFEATLNPEDPAFWNAVQAKYRRLLKVLPELDGVRHRTGEATRVGGNFKAFDVMHDGESDWSLAKRYRTWVKKIHEVVVGEFDKIYYQRTWVTSSHEQHSMAEVYKEIFTEDVPVKNLYMSPYMSTTDRYFHQPYNPTFNLTPHNMIVLLSPLNYHGNNNCGILPTFPGSYYQGGLKTYLSVENSNCKGTDFGLPVNEGWDTWSLTAYTVYRLTWEPNLDVAEIVQDYATMYFGNEAADELAEVLLLTPKIYKYGLYIEPAAHGQFSSLTHLRLTTFPSKGLPRLDSGRKHMEFLYNIYLRCRPWIEETYLNLDHGLALAEKAKNIIQLVANKILDSKKRMEVLNNSEMTYELVKVNNYFVKSFISYFQYRDTKTLEDKIQLENYSKLLHEEIKLFKNVPEFVYRLDGIEQLQVNINDALENLDLAEAKFAEAPDDDEIEKLINEQQSKYIQVLEKYKNEAVKILSWQGRVDGRDLLKMRGDKTRIEHLRYDNIQEVSEELFNSLPLNNFTVIPLDIQSRSFGPFILEQPSEENDFTTTIYLSDFPMHGYSWWKFELFYIPRSPKELGLDVPW